MIIKILLIFVLSSLALVAGDMDSGGSGTYAKGYGAAWFLQNKKEDRVIRVCISHDYEKFPVKLSEIKKTIIEVSKTWENYIEKKRVFDGELVIGVDKVLFTYVKEMVFVDSCLDEKQYDLKMYFGTKNEFIKKIEKINGSLAAYAHRESYNYKIGQGKGFIWVNESYISKEFRMPGPVFCWDKNRNLYGVLLHEVGHVFGNSHIAGTIMRRNLAEDMACGAEITDKELKNYYEKRILKIDQNNMLKRCASEKCINNDLNGTMWAKGSLEEKTVFKLLTGKIPRGPVTVKAVDGHLQKDENIILEISDQKSKYEFEMIIPESIHVDIIQNEDVAKFKRYREAKVNGNDFYSPISLGDNVFELHNVYGQLKDKQGKVYSVAIRYNKFRLELSLPLGAVRNDNVFYEHQGPYTMFIFANGKRHYLLSNIKKIDLSSKIGQFYKKYFTKYNKLKN